MPDPLIDIKVTDIGEFIRHQSCARRFKLSLAETKDARELPFFDRLFNPLDIVLQESGRSKENEWEGQLIEAGFLCLTPSQSCTSNSDVKEQKEPIPWNDFICRLRDLDHKQRAYGRNIGVYGDIGAFHVGGALDFLLFTWDKGGNPKLKIVECKASRRDRTYHRIQVALYHKMLQRLIQNNPLEVRGKRIKSEDVACAVARIDESTNSIQSILELPPIDRGDLSQIEEDIERLLADNGRLRQIADNDICSLPYQLEEKCNTCIFDVYCLPESGRNHSLELLGAEPSIIRALRSQGISNIDQLAELDPNSTQAQGIRSTQGFSASLEVLKEKASARLSTLPGVSFGGPLYKIRSLPFTGKGQLPEHAIDGQRLIRIYLSVDYDYVENRVGALSAHVTTSEGKIYTGFLKNARGWHPDPQVKEAWPIESSATEQAKYNYRPLDTRKSQDTVCYKTEPWTGCYAVDTDAEREIIEGFLRRLAKSIIAVAQADNAPLHFYVWSRSEMAHLVEACSRAGTTLLHHLNELLGCREGLDQLIFSCLGDEVDTRYALGWTGRGLVVATSLDWFGWRYHWLRNVADLDVDLERAFTQDIFDFRMTLDIVPIESPQMEAIPAYRWASKEDVNPDKHRFETRSRFFDSLPAPYWHGAWCTLPKPEDQEDKRVANAIKYYQNASIPGYLEAYLIARTQALRWVEERILWKNQQIRKPLIDLYTVTQFSLGVDNICQAAIDFLRLDTHVHVRDWTAAHLIPPAYRISSGRTVPIGDVHSKWNAGRKEQELVASINLTGYGIEPQILAANCSINQRSFVRVTPCGENPTHGQRLGQLHYEGSTCVVRSIDWTGLKMVMGIRPMPASRYRLHSEDHGAEGLVFNYATVDESPSEFTAPKVERALKNDKQAPVYRWLDPQNPAVPAQCKLDPQAKAIYNRVLKTWLLPGGAGGKLLPEQRNACINGLDARIQLLHGPPGTGKTITTATSVLLRALARLSVGDVVLLVASTHVAVNILLESIDKLMDSFTDQVNKRRDSFTDPATIKRLSMPPIKLAKAVSSLDSPLPAGNIQVIASKPATSLKDMRSDSVAVIGGTPSSILQLWHDRGTRLKDLRASLLVVDEASMMIFPHFLGLATLVDSNSGQIILAGDHQQLPPIVAHDWQNEDRPPIVLYQPYTSAYVAIQSICQKQADSSRVLQSALQFSFRLPLEIRDLVNRLYRQETELHGRHASHHRPPPVGEGNVWESVWYGETGLYLVTHSEKQSKLSNNIEVHIIEQILACCGPRRSKSVAVITPHRAQRGVLTMRLQPYTDGEGIIYVIDTVESFQGGEQDTIIVSATKSDPVAISASAKFILDLKRSNVAFSRAKERLIVICSEALLDFIPPEASDYEATLLWRALRRLCSRPIATQDIEVDGEPYRVNILTYNPNVNWES